jgi:hypothetical protein
VGPPPASGEDYSDTPDDRPLKLSLDDENCSGSDRVIQVPPPPRPLQAVPVPGGTVIDDARPWTGQDAAPRRDWEPHRGVLIVVLGVVSLTVLFCPLLGLPSGLAAWSMGRTDLERMRMNEMDPEGSALTRAGMWCGVIGTFLQGLISLGLGLIVVAGA